MTTYDEVKRVLYTSHRYFEENWSEKFDGTLGHPAIEGAIKSIAAKMVEAVLANMMWEELIKGNVQLVSDRDTATNDTSIKAWDVEDELKPLAITSPPDWDYYNDYLLNGGTMEYEHWRAVNNVTLD